MVVYRLTSSTVADAVAGRPRERTDEAELLDEIARYEAKLDEATDLFADDAITAVQLRRTTARLTAKIDAARAKLATGERGTRLAHVTANAAELADQWDSLTVEAKHAVLASLIDRIEITPGVRGSHHVDIESRVHVRWIV